MKIAEILSQKLSGTVSKTVSVSYNREAKDKGRSHDVEIEFDLDGLTGQDLLDFGIATAVIRTQNAVRSLPSEDALENVLDRLPKNKDGNPILSRSMKNSSAKIEVPTIDKMKVLLSQLSAEERAALMAELA